MCGVSSFTGFFCVAWPNAEFAGMVIEGSVKLGYRKELEAIEDPEERLAEYQRRVDRAYHNAKGVNASAGYGIDDVIGSANCGVARIFPGSTRLYGLSLLNHHSVVITDLSIF